MLTAAHDDFMPQGGVLAASKVVATGKGSADYAVSMADINRLLPNFAKGVFRAKQAWAELTVCSGLMPGFDGHCRHAQPHVVARASFELGGGVAAAVAFSGRATLKEGPMFASVWSVRVLALGSYEPPGADKRILGGRLGVVGTLPLSLVVNPKRGR